LAGHLTYRNAHLIYNPNAGGLRRASVPRLARAIELLRAQGLDVVERPTSRPGEASELAARSVREGADLVLVAGGDGTINEAVNGMVHSDVPLAVLPAGTANVLAVELGFGVSLRRAVQRLGELAPARISVGLLRPTNGPDRHFLLMAGAGLDADIVNHVEPDFKRRLGKLAYWLAAFSQIGRKLPQFRAGTAGWTCRTGFALATRVRNYGGDLEIARNITLLDDDFEIVAFEGEDAMTYLKYLGGLLVGNLGSVPGVHMRRSPRLDLAAPEAAGIAIHVDGELAGAVPATIEIVRDSLTLLVPPGLDQRYRSRERRG
jgi:diacylglycerol kinase family enzyme